MPDPDLQRVERVIERLADAHSALGREVGGITQRMNTMERDVSSLSDTRDVTIKLQAQWENFLATDLPELNAKLDKSLMRQDEDTKARVQEREENRKDRRNTLIALLSIAGILLAAFIPILLAGVH